MTMVKPVKMPAPTAGALKIAPYVQGQSEIAGIARPIKLSSNESPLGPSPKAIEAYKKAGETLYRYPDGSQLALRTAIGETFALDPARVICGNGSDELIQILIRAYVGFGEEIIVSQNAFAMCRVHALAQGAVVVNAPEPHGYLNVDEILKQVTDKTRMVTIASPNNPFGTFLPRLELEYLHRELPGNVILLVDAAYADYVTDKDYDSGLSLASSASNVVMTRTFSKLYGLAALRVGWAYGPAAVIEIMNRIRTPFNANAAALAAAAAAVRDIDYAAFVRDHNNLWLKRMSEALAALRLEVVPSVTNFIMIKFPGGKHSAENAWHFLLSKGIIPRPVNAGGPNDSLRITIGLDSENEAVLAALAEFMDRK